jgi:hypothetical protein
MIRAMTALAHCSLFEGVTFVGNEFLMLFWWCLVRCYKD